MPIVAFIFSLLFCSLVLTFVGDRSEQGSASENFDYHYVPYAGDSFGA